MIPRLRNVFCILIGLLIASGFAQAPQDPLRDFCRRYGHQTAVLDGKLYIDGGWVYANPISQNPVPTINQGLIYSDLNETSDGMPKQYANLTKNLTVPNVAGGTLWADDVNKVFWLYGGEFSTAPSPFQLWGYDTILNQWNMSTAATTATSAIQRVSYGAGTTIGGKGYYYGGYLNSLTNPLWYGDQLATSNLVIFDMDTNTLSNNTGYDSIGRAEGVMLSIPASSAGLLIYFGGVSFPYGNITEVAMEMSQVIVYDVGDAKWYTQTTTGNIPGNRRKFCAGATWTEDQSSYNIYLYGGFGFGENITGFDDVYILSMPTFEWIKWYPDAPGASAPHGMLTCNIIGMGQMMVMGGNFTNSTDCDVPNVGAQHNLNLGQVDPTNAKWYQFLPNITDYSVPEAIISVAGGSSDGGASNLSPASGWSDSALSVYFGEKAQFDTRTPTRYIPAATTAPKPTSTPSPSKSNTGAIAGGAVGGAFALIITALLIWWFCLRKRKSAQSQQHASHSQVNTVNEMSANPNRDSKYRTSVTTATSPGSLGYPHHSPFQPTTPTPPIQPGYASPYQYPGHGNPQQYFPMHMQQQGYGPAPPQAYPAQHYSPPSGSPPPHMGGGAYMQQQGYFPHPPPEIQRMSPPAPAPAYEMPVRGMTPGMHHVVHQPVAQRGDMIPGVAQFEGSVSLSGRSEDKQREEERSQSTRSGSASGGGWR